MLKFESRHSHQSACCATKPMSPHQQALDEIPSVGCHDMDSLLSTIQEQYFSAVASTLSRAIVLASNGPVGQARYEKVSPTPSNGAHKQPKSVFESQAKQEQARQQHQQSSRRRALNKQQDQRQNNPPPTNPTTPLDLSKRTLTTSEIEPATSCSDTASSSLLFPLNLVTKTEEASAGGAISGSALIASSTVSPASSGSPTSSLSSSSSSAISSSGPLSSEFEGARSRTGAQVEASKSQDKKQQRRRPTKKLKGSKSHLCAHCGRSFSRSDMLTRHSRLHSGLKPYQCAKCLQVFSRSDHLSTHERTHTGEKPYQCKFCSYSACRRDMITRHMRTHTIGALANSDPNSAALLGVQVKLTAGQSSDSTQVGQKSARTKRRQNIEADSSLEHKLFRHSETGQTQQLVPTQIEHFHRP